MGNFNKAAVLDVRSKLGEGRVEVTYPIFVVDTNRQTYSWQFRTGNAP